MPATAMMPSKSKPKSAKHLVKRVAAAAPARRGRMVANLVVRADTVFKRLVHEAAQLRGLSDSDYVRSELAARARQQIEDARRNTLRLEPQDQVAFWKALNAPPKVTPTLRRLGANIRAHLGA